MAGCSTGEEAYSMAICLTEFMADKPEKVQIFATDVSGPAIVKARTGIYTRSEVSGISALRLEAFFTKADGGYQLSKSLRSSCVFAIHNFLKDPPFGRLDFVSCRNVLIYMEPYLQKKALTTFHYSLQPNGFLLLGRAESTNLVPDLFSPSARQDKLFIRKDAPARFMHVASPRQEQNLQTDVLLQSAEKPLTDFQKSADELLLSKYIPASVVVNEALDIVHFRGNTAGYLEQSPGKPSHNLLKMAREGLAFSLRTLLHKAKKTAGPVRKEDVVISGATGKRTVMIEAVLLPNMAEPHYLILFHDTGAAPLTAAPARGASDSARQIQKLEKELLQTHEDMRSITEEQETANEELQSANEELLSGSEELQSLNEELEASKEELQSTNEELTVLNQELLSLNDQVTEGRAYAESIITTIRQPLLVLDRKLRVKKANAAFYKAFRVAEKETENELIYNLGNRQWDIPALRVLLEELLPRKREFIDYEVVHDFPLIGQRILLLSALEIVRSHAEEKLILLSIEDVTEERALAKTLQRIEKEEADARIATEKKVTAAYKAADAYLRNVFMQAPAAICMFQGPEHIYTLVNEMYLQIIGNREVMGRSVKQGLPELEGQGFFERLDEVYKTGKPFKSDETLLKMERGNGKTENRFINFIYQPTRSTGLKVTGVLVVAVDVTEQVAARQKIEEANSRYYATLMQSPFAFSVIKGRNMEITLANTLMKEFWGKGDAVEGKALLQVLPELENQPFPGMINSVYTTGLPVYANEILARLNRHGKPEEKYFNIVYQPYLEADESISGVITIAHEVTAQVLARKKAEMQNAIFSDMLMTAPGFVATLDGPLHVYGLVNEQYQRLFGSRQIQGKPIMEALPELEGQGFDTLLDEVYATGNTYVGIDVPIVLAREEGAMPEQRYFNFSYQPMYDEAKTINAILVFGYEVTEQVLAKNRNIANVEEYAMLLEEKVELRTTELRQSYDVLSQKNEELVQMNRELEAFTYVSSHDLQEPLRKIQTFADRILEKEHSVLSVTGKDYFNRLQKSAARMQTLIDDLLTYSHTSVANRKSETADLFKTVADVAAEFSDALAEKNGVIDNQTTGTCTISPFQLRQVMVNLVSNAIKFAKAGVPLVISLHNITGTGQTFQANNPSLSAGKLAPDATYCHIRLTDNGIGFEPEYNQKIFELFQRLHGREEYVGTGIGLAIIKKIIETHQGVITATGRLHKGATFDIYLPAAEPTDVSL